MRANECYLYHGMNTTKMRIATEAENISPVVSQLVSSSDFFSLISCRRLYCLFKKLSLFVIWLSQIKCPQIILNTSLFICWFYFQVIVVFSLLIAAYGLIFYLLLGDEVIRIESVY